MAEHNLLGKQGEETAVTFLAEKGYTILERNYRFHKAEIDIIARKEHTVIAIEVKTRSTADFGDLQEFVKPEQVKRLVQALDHYIREAALDVDARFDFIGIIKSGQDTRVQHVEDAFLYY